MSCVYVLGTVTRRGNFREIDGCMLMKRKYEKKGGKTRSKQKKRRKGVGGGRGVEVGKVDTASI